MLFVFFFIFPHNVPGLLQVLQSLWISETLYCTCPKTCPCCCSCPQTESQGKVTFHHRLKAPWIWDLENVGMVHALWGSFPLLRHDACLWEQDLIYSDSWNKAAIHSRTGRGRLWGEEFYLQRGFLFNISGSHNHLLQAGTAQNITVCFFFDNRSIFT